MVVDIKASLAGAKAVQRFIKQSREKHKKALRNALKIEGYRLRAEMQKELKAGKAGHQRLKSLSLLASVLDRRRRSERTPFERMVPLIRYHFNPQNNSISIGFTGPKVTQQWRDIMIRQQTGFTKPVTLKTKKYFIGKGLEVADKMRHAQFNSTRKIYSKGSTIPRYFLWHKGTENITVPARPFVEPFWQAHREEASNKIRDNFLRKLRGERIKTNG